MRFRRAAGRSQHKNSLLVAESMFADLTVLRQTDQVKTPAAPEGIFADRHAGIRYVHREHRSVFKCIVADFPCLRRQDDFTVTGDGDAVLIHDYPVIAGNGHDLIQDLIARLRAQLCISVSEARDILCSVIILKGFLVNILNKFNLIVFWTYGGWEINSSRVGIHVDGCGVQTAIVV